MGGGGGGGGQRERVNLLSTNDHYNKENCSTQTGQDQVDTELHVILSRPVAHT